MNLGLNWVASKIHDSKWIENVNIILIRPQQKQTITSKYNYEVCNIESHKLTFVVEDNNNNARKEGTERISPGKRRHLPAANLHESDFAPEWRSILGANIVHRYEQVTVTTNSTNSDNRNANVSIPIFSDENIVRKSAIEKLSSNCGKILRPQLALRICAIRCLFQELGKLIKFHSCCLLKMIKCFYSIIIVMQCK